MKNEYLFNTFRLIVKALRQRTGRAVRRKEKKLEDKVVGQLNAQKEFILKGAKRLFGKKNFDYKTDSEDIDALLDEIPDEIMIDIIIAESKDTMKLGAKTSIAKNKLSRFGISFTLDHPLAEAYLKTDRPLILAKLSQTVKDEIKPILQDALKTGQSYNDTAKIISESFGLSRSRAQMIATNEIGHAYAQGQKIPVQDAVDKGKTARKKWLTTGDDRVTEECAANGSEGWIGWDETFSSGDTEAPRDTHPRCRCDTLTEVE